MFAMDLGRFGPAHDPETCVAGSDATRTQMNADHADLGPGL